MTIRRLALAREIRAEDRYVYTPTKLRWLLKHYRCCLHSFRWCPAARRLSAQLRSRWRVRVTVGGFEEIAQCKADVDAALSALGSRYRFAARLLVAHGPGYRSYFWWDRRAERAHATVKALRRLTDRAVRAMARASGWAPRANSEETNAC